MHYLNWDNQLIKKEIKMSDYQEVFDSSKDLSEDECVMAIHAASEGEMSIKDAQSEYRTLATEAGMIKTPAQKKVEWEDAVEGIDLSTEEGVNEAKAIGVDMEIGTQTIMKYMKVLATERGVELATTVTNRGNSMSGQLKEWFMENYDATNADIVEKGIELGMSEISAKYYVPIYNTAKELATVIASKEG